MPAAAKPRDGFAQHVGASPGDRAKDLRHRAAHADQVVSAVEAGRDHHRRAPQQRDASGEQPRRQRRRVGAEKHRAAGAVRRERARHPRAEASGALVDEFGAEAARGAAQVVAAFGAVRRAGGDHDSPGSKRAAFGQRVEDESAGQLGRIGGAQARDEPGFGMAGERLAAKDDQRNVTQRNVAARSAIACERRRPRLSRRRCDVARAHRATQFPSPPLWPIPLMILSGSLSTLVRKYATEVIGWGTTWGLLSGPVTWK